MTSASLASPKNGDRLSNVAPWAQMPECISHAADVAPSLSAPRAGLHVETQDLPPSPVGDVLAEDIFIVGPRDG